MYIEHKGKVYVQKDDVLVGVDITPEVIIVKGTEVKLSDLECEYYLVSTGEEVRARHNISEQTPYKFPVEKTAEVEKPKRGTPSTK